MRRAARRRPAAGFTLLELMVALVVGGIFVGSVYAVAKASTRHFYQQHGIAQMQASLRYAMNQLKKDIAKAGLFASPNAGLVQLQSECGPPSGNLHAPLGSGGIAGISSFTDNCITQPSCDDVTAAQLNRTGNGVQLDSLVLLGNYVTASEYPLARALLVSRNQVSIERQWHSFQRDFTTWYHSGGTAAAAGLMGQLNEAALRQAFMPGRMVGLRTMTGGMHFSTVGGVTVSAGSTEEPVLVSLDQAIPLSCNVSGGWISPLNFIRYVVEAVPANTASSERFAGLKGSALQLIRREVNPNDKVLPLQPNCTQPGTPCTPDRVVLDYVVDFNVDFQLATATTPQVPDIVPLDAIVPRTGTAVAVQNTPELIRSVIINLAVRSSDFDPNLQHLGPKANPWGPLLTYEESIAGTDFTARVRAMTAEIFVPNIAYSGH